MQNISETKQHLSTRFGEHRWAAEKAINHCHIKLIPLELINSHGDTIRKAKEAVLIIINNTLERHEMNKRHKTQSVFICIFFTIILILFALLFLLYT